VANLNPDQLRILQDLIEGFDRLTARARDTADVFEQKLGSTFDKKMQAAADRAADLAKAQAAAALSTVKGMKQKERDAAIEAAGKRAASKVQREYDENARAASGALRDLGNNLTRLTGAIYKGERGMGPLAESASGAVDSIGKVAFLMGGPMVKAITVAITTLFKFGKVAADQADKLYVSYTNLQKSGAAAADGMTGVMQMAQNFGLGVEELEKLETIIAKNSQILTVFQGNVMDGSRALSGVAQGIVRTNLVRQFMNMGMSLESINEGISSYIALQSRVGLAQNKTQAELTKGAVRYLEQMDGLTKLTGIQRQELEEGIDKGRAIEAFRAKTESLRASGQVEEAERMEQYYAILLKQAPTLAQGYAEAATGLIVSPAGRQFFQAIEAGTGVVNGLSSGAMSLGQALNATYNQAKLSEVQFRDLAMAMASGDVIGSYTELADLGKRAGLDQEAMAAIIKDAQEKQKAGADGLVKIQTDTRVAQMESMLSMQNFVNIGVKPATMALRYFANTIETITSILPGGGKPGQGFNQLGYGAQGAGSQKGSLGATAAGAATGAAVGSVVPILGTTVGAIVGGIAGYLGYEAMGGANIDDLLEFGGDSGSRENFMALDPKVREAVILAAQEYQQLTGQKLLINSGKRSREDQERLYNEYLRRGRTGMPVAPPGSSSHESGLAVDIQQGKTDRRAIDILNRYGLMQSVAGDPVHFTPSSANLPGYAYGGIAQGPKSGYQATLHDTEAVVPLPDGRTIPVQMPAMNENMREQISMLREQTSKLDELINVMRTQNSISSKLLMVSQN